MDNVTTLHKSKPRHRLDPEPWGHRLTRAREKAGYTLRDLDGAKRHLGFGRGIVHLLEQLSGAPEDALRRRQAFVLITFLGFDPAEFDLGPDDGPSSVIDLRTLAELGKSSTKWFVAAAA